MISLKNLTHTYPGRDPERPVLNDITLDLPTDRRLGILGAENAGKTTLMRLLAGFETPNAGSISRFARLSLPIGYEGVFKRHLSPRENLAEFAHVFGEEIESISNFVQSMAEMDDSFDTPLSKISPELQRRFVFTAGYALPFDCYLIDERFTCGPSDNDFVPKCTAMLQVRAASGGIIFASRRTNLIQRFCEIAAVLENGRLTLYDDIEAAIAAYSRQPKANSA